MPVVSSVADLPDIPAVYGLHDRRTGTLIYLGETGNLRARIKQHLVSRDSSVVTGAFAASINPDLVGEVRWWEHVELGDRPGREAAELVAVALLNPVLRDRDRPQSASVTRFEDRGFRSRMEGLFQSPATGRMVVPTLQEALARIAAIESELAQIRERLAALEDPALSRERRTDSMG
ncbi:MAG TPA: hypothetical protein VMU89_09850 [Thermomicrobiaceae bacterium]|nr:hypothetical protein [Thermomicrobiaceae bacterium]